MYWYVLVVTFAYFAGLDRQVACQHDGLSKYSYITYDENELENTATNGTNEGVAEMDVFRLSTDIVPLSYVLEVATEFANFTYSGKVEIVIQTTTKACQIVLNAKGILVTEVQVIDLRSNVVLGIAKYYFVDKNEQLVIELNDTNRCLTASRPYVVKVTFEASLRNDMSGYYKSSYKENDVTKWLAVTHFEPTFARRAFPCFDEPIHKVPFKVSLRRRSDQISLSNMPLINSTKVPLTNMYWDHFQETPPMSSYLVAFFVGEFYAIKTPTVGVYTHKSYIGQTEYIANKAAKLLKAMENFTGVDYMMPKIDLLAIPDFSIGAMENWGMNTYRERLLLLADNSKTIMKEYVTTIVQHELSHQWFGDLVTCAWWDYLWLNEGFATYFEYFATKMVEPNWRLEDVFVYEVHQSALKTDQYSTHPITGSVRTPAEINDMFDDISYSKAGTVLRMLQYSVTENNFKKALNLYIRNNKYQAVTPEELWTAFESVLSDTGFELEETITLTQYMKSWTEQAGYPLVNIVKINNTFVITQERFFVDISNETDTTQWIIGLTYTTESEKNFNKVLPKTWMKENQIVLPNQTETGWYIFNLKSIGFYRVNYDEYNWNALIKQLNNNCSIIHVLNRAQLIDDVFNLALANEVDYSLVFKLTKYLKNENDVVPWFSAKNGFPYLLNRMRRNSDYYKQLKTYVGYLAGLIYKKTEDLVVIHNSTEHSILTGWNVFSNWACSLDNEICTKSMSTYFDLWSQGKQIPADIKEAALCVGVKNGNSVTWNNILQVYVDSESSSDRQSAQRALACSKDELQLSEYLDFMFDGYNGPIRPQDFKVIYQNVAESPQGISALTQFLTTKLDRIVKEIVNGERVATSIYSILTSRVALPEEILKIDELRKNITVPEYLRKRFDAYFRTVEDNLDWFYTFDSEVGEWSKITVHELGLDSNQPIDSTVSPVPSPGTTLVISPDTSPTTISTTPPTPTPATSQNTSPNTSQSTSPATTSDTESLQTVMPSGQIKQTTNASAKVQTFGFILLIITSTLLLNIF